jgi:hypothetical protein
MVAAATAWVRAARPDLTPEQVAQVVRLSAVNVGAAGWDPVTGYGLLNVDRALSQQAPPADPFEPNDDIAWVSGRAFGKASAAIWSRGKAARFSALVDAFEDPADVYRVRLPGRARVRVSVKPRSGATDVAAHNASARAIDESRNLLARSRRSGRRTDTLNLRNRSRRTRTVYVSVAVDRNRGNLNAVYSLVVRRR